MSEDIERFLGDYGPQVQELANELRAAIKALAPEAQEKLYPGWKNIGYNLNSTMSSQFAAIGPQKNYVNLYLVNGNQMADPTGLLQGAGKNMRHVKLRSVAEIHAPAVADLIRQAISLRTATSETVAQQ